MFFQGYAPFIDVENSLKTSLDNDKPNYSTKNIFFPATMLMNEL